MGSPGASYRRHQRTAVFTAGAKGKAAAGVDQSEGVREAQQ
jgi:hypothetical protein